MQQISADTTYSLIELLTVDSTSRYLKQFITARSTRDTQPIVCTTQQQTSGYGQRNQAWLTTEQSCIFSVALFLPSNKPLQPSLSLKVAVLLHQTLAELIADRLWLKWPNDLYNQQGKVAGILIELSKDSLGRRWLVIGIGINRQPLTAQQHALGAGAVTYFQPKALFDKLMIGFQGLDFNKADLAYWQQYDWFKPGESLLLIDQYQQTQTLVSYQSIDPNGRACVEINNDGNIKRAYLSSGQTSLRSMRR